MSIPDIHAVTSGLEEMLIEKNRRYGDSVLNPVGIFSKHIDADQDTSFNAICARLDDKLARIKNSEILRGNDVADLLGYLVFLAIKMEIDFNALID